MSVQVLQELRQTTLEEWPKAKQMQARPFFLVEAKLASPEELLTVIRI